MKREKCQSSDFMNMEVSESKQQGSEPKIEDE